MEDIAMLSHGFSKHAVIDVGIADRIGATIVIGEPDDTEALRTDQDLPVSPMREGQAKLAASKNLPASVINWLRTGERGLSSNAMCQYIYCFKISAGKDYPHDPDDLGRCLKFLAAIGRPDAYEVMADVSPEWSALVNIWPSLVRRFNAELPSGKCPETYHMMREALSSTKQSAR
ncbi:MAG: hypothetical protein HGA79_08650 [Anaerolineales bacterium]|nr:hypothetical protein [Anaerolineales bacterium]